MAPPTSAQRRLCPVATVSLAVPRDAHLIIGWEGRAAEYAVPCSLGAMDRTCGAVRGFWPLTEAPLADLRRIVFGCSDGITGVPEKDRDRLDFPRKTLLCFRRYAL